MGTVVLAVGLVLIVEGLVFALAPLRLEEVLEALKNMPSDTRRLLGLGALALGVFLVWLTKSNLI